MYLNLLPQDSVKSLMNPRVISVLPATPVLVAIDILLSNNFNGVAVVDKVGIIVGILTKYDIITKRQFIRDDTKVEDVMNKEPLVLLDSMNVDDAIRMFSEHHKVDPIPVIDENRRVIGVVSRHDMVKLFREYGVSGSSKPKKDNTPYGLLFLILIAVLLGVAYYLGYLDSLRQIF